MQMSRAEVRLESSSAQNKHQPGRQVRKMSKGCVDEAEGLPYILEQVTLGYFLSLFLCSTPVLFSVVHEYKLQMDWLFITSSSAGPRAWLNVPFTLCRLCMARCGLVQCTVCIATQLCTMEPK